MITLPGSPRLPESSALPGGSFRDLWRDTKNEYVAACSGFDETNDSSEPESEDLGSCGVIFAWKETQYTFVRPSAVYLPKIETAHGHHLYRHHDTRVERDYDEWATHCVFIHPKSPEVMRHRIARKYKSPSPLAREPFSSGWFSKEKLAAHIAYKVKGAADALAALIESFILCDGPVDIDVGLHNAVCLKYNDWGVQYSEEVAIPIFEDMHLEQNVPMMQAPFVRISLPKDSQGRLEPDMEGCRRVLQRAVEAFLKGTDLVKSEKALLPGVPINSDAELQYLHYEILWHDNRVTPLWNNNRLRCVYFPRRKGNMVEYRYHDTAKGGTINSWAKKYWNTPRLGYEPGCKHSPGIPSDTKNSSKRKSKRRPSSYMETGADPKYSIDPDVEASWYGVPRRSTGTDRRYYRT
ncbi:hypothetical protein F4780DRAFT_754446 [Xylariomycetidae sp. FL0641]|nr:hypothetical protein F4780DRAFT_754446 [Xylariomycetidae sp. FL0641]